MSTTCYRKAKDLEHGHFGPFSRCRKCGRIICEECIGRHLESGQVHCVECSHLVTTTRSNRAGLQLRVETRKYLTTALRYGAISIKSVFSAIAWASITLLSVLIKPWQADYNQVTRWDNPIKFDVTWSNYRDKVWFAFFFIAVILIAIIAAIFYSLAGGIPFARIMFALTATIIFWGILATYIQYPLRGLPRPIPQIAAYVASIFVALLFAIWLINLDFFDALFKPFGG